MSAGGLVIRPARAGDAEAMWDLLRPAADEVMGMTSLPSDLPSAHRICEETARTVAELATGSFNMADGDARRLLFVAVDTTAPAGPSGQEILGLTGVTFKQAVPNLAVKVTTSKDGQGLIMSSSSQPWTRTELDSSFIAAKARGKKLGTLLSRGRFMLLHLVRSQIPQTVASHLRGRFDADGSAPFWRCFGAKFAPRWETSTEAEIALIEDPALLGDLAGHRSPVTPVVLQSLGPVNDASLPAFHLLSMEGMTPNGMYDPIDGGPTVIVDLADTVTGRTRTHGRVVIGEQTPVDALVSVATVADFRATRAPIGIPDATRITIEATTAATLAVEPGALIVAAGLDPADVLSAAADQQPVSG